MLQVGQDGWQERLVRRRAVSSFRGIPTSALLEMWSAERERVSHLERPSQRDYCDLLAMRTELDRRLDEPKPIVDVNFTKDYLSD